jgi:CheY-like chemotaxis protein
MNILMVDDNPGKLLSYEAILSELGENLLKATFGREALESTAQERYRRRAHGREHAGNRRFCSSIVFPDGNDECSPVDGDQSDLPAEAAFLVYEDGTTAQPLPLCRA